EEAATAAPTQTDPVPGRPPGGPVGLRGPTDHRRRPGRGHAGDHGRHHRAAGQDPRRGAARRALRHEGGPPQGGRGQEDRTGTCRDRDGRKRRTRQGRRRYVTAQRGTDDVRIAVLGAGSWGTVFANVIADAADLSRRENPDGPGTEVVLWGRRPSAVDAINEESEQLDYFLRTALTPRLGATADVTQALAGADVVVLAVPSQTLRENLASWRPHIAEDAVVVSLMKGVELRTLMRVSQIIAEVLEFSEERIAVVSGPNLALEIGRET